MTTHIIGHKRVKNILDTSLKNHRLSHAYLFHGMEGIGKRLLAYHFALDILAIGSQLSVELISKKVSEQNHPDFWIMGQEAGSIKIEDVENLQLFLRTKPLESDYKVVLIDNAHELTEQAQNRLLKTIEEPPQYVILLLVTHRPSDLLETIHSRVESLSMNPLSMGQMQEVLQGMQVTSAISMADVAGMSEGSVMRAIQIVEDPAFLQMRDFIIGWFSDIISGSALNALRKLDRQEIDKTNVGLALMLLRLCLRDILVTQQGAMTYSVLKDIQGQLLSISQKIHPRKVVPMLEAVEKAEKSLERMVQPMLVMDVLSYTLQEVNRD
jgi:DNA polymerase-3 subunit delta'